MPAECKNQTLLSRTIAKPPDFSADILFVLCKYFLADLIGWVSVLIRMVCENRLNRLRNNMEQSNDLISFVFQQ